MKIAAGQQRCDGLRLCQRRDVARIHLLEMIAAGRAQFHRQLRRARAGKLFRMQLGYQAVPPACFQDMLCLLASKRPAIAEHIAEFREFFFRNFWNQLLCEQLNVPFHPRRRSAILRRDDVSAEERRDDVQRLFRGQFLVQP